MRAWIALALVAAAAGRAGTDVPAPLPPPVAAADPLDLLWDHRLQFDRTGEPLVTVRLAEGRREISFRARGPAELRARGGETVRVASGARLRARPVEALPAALAHHVLL